jgi:glycosyltransferase involved in cell wall biosynthesis
MAHQISAPKVKVLIISPTSESVGVSTHIYNLAKMLYSVDMLDMVICPNRGWLTIKLTDSKIPYRVLSVPYQARYFIPSAIKIMKFLRSRRYANIVHVHGRASLFICMVPLFFFSRMRFAATMHQFIKSGSSGIFSWKTRLETVLLRRIDKICCVSESLKKETQLRVGERKQSLIQKIPNWIEPYWYQIDSPIQTRIYSVDNKKIKLCGIGRLAFEKGFDILLEAVGILKNQGYEAACDIYGEGPEKGTLNDQIYSLGISENITLMGARANVRLLLPQYDIFVIPSRSESFGIAALEAFDASIPVIASDIEGLREIVVDGYSGLSFEAGNAQALATAVIILINSKETRRELVSAGHSILGNHILNQALIDKYMEFYSGALIKSKADIVS